MAILKHFAVKNADYGAAIDYLKYQHDEFHLVPILDENGNSIHFISGSESDIFHTIDLAKKYLHHVNPEYA